MSVPPEIKKLREQATKHIGLPHKPPWVYASDAEAAVTAALARQRDEIVDALRNPADADRGEDVADFVARRFPNGGTNDGK